MSALPHPTTAKDWHERGTLLNASGDHSGAVSALNSAIQCQPDYIPACFDLARLVEDTGSAELAVKIYSYLLVISPGHAEGQRRLTALQQTLQKIVPAFLAGVAAHNRGEMEQAVAHFREALAIHPRVPDTLSNLALALYHLRRFEDAQECITEALRLQPNHLGALATRGNIFQTLGASQQAITIYRYILSLKPDDAKAWANIGKVLQRTEDDAGAVEAYAAALRIEPDNAEILSEYTYRLYRLCRWDKALQAQKQLTRVLRATNQNASPFLVTLFADRELQRDNAKRYAAAHYAAGKTHVPKQKLPSSTRDDGKLRIGYMSADFYHHATAFLISELFEHHDKARFDIIAYSCGMGAGSAEQARIRDAVTDFRDIKNMDSAAAADVIRADGIDILIDLKGYTRGERMDVLALRPAPIQMHYLGYPGTTGAPFIDYFIADSITAPHHNEFTEKLIYLPDCYQINDRKRSLPHGKHPRSYYGLPEKAFVFCDFNNAYKITPEIFAVWLQLLKAVPGSVLWLYETHSEATENLRKEAANHGISATRLITAKIAPIADHLERYHHVDLFLDTAPVSGHTTVSDALWCGVPVVTLKGDSFVSRVAASLLKAVELPQLIARDIADYERVALELATDSKRLDALKHHLRKGRMRFPLFDSLATTRALESAYEKAATAFRAPADAP